MPTPKSGESQQDFHSRCMSQLVGEEGYEQDQANAICYSMWDERNESVKTITVNEELTLEQEDGTKVILEAGDKIRIKESHFNSLAPEFLQQMKDAYEEDGMNYVIEEFMTLISYAMEDEEINANKELKRFVLDWNSWLLNQR